MALQFSAAVLNARLNSIETTVGAAPVLRLYTGSPPANCAAAATGTQLASFALPSTWMAAASAGVVGLSGSWSGAASTGGTAGYFRIYDPTGTTCHTQGTVGTTGTDMIVTPSATLTASQPFLVTAFNITDPNS